MTDKTRACITDRCKSGDEPCPTPDECEMDSADRVVVVAVTLLSCAITLYLIFVVMS